MSETECADVENHDKTQRLCAIFGLQDGAQKGEAFRQRRPKGPSRGVHEALMTAEEAAKTAQ